MHRVREVALGAQRETPRRGLDAALVLAGGTTAEKAQEAKKPRPVAVAEDLGKLVLG